VASTLVEVAAELPDICAVLSDGNAMPRQKLDRRQERTRAALLQAFRDLILRQRYDEVGVADVAAQAKVSRSTLYEHFSGKNGLLAASIAGPFALLAATLDDADNARELLALLEHFWSNRALARVLLAGAARRKTVAVLIAQVERNLNSAGYGRRGRLILPVRLAAVQLAEVLLAPVTAWLVGESRCSATLLAQALRQVSRAALASLSASGR
jgi:AcrR family transcriptional regulator